MALDLGTLRASVEFNTSQATKQAKTFGRTVGQELPRNMKRSSKSTKDLNKAQKSYQKSTQDSARSTSVFNDGMFQLTKSTQLALGPLSGVAARMTAFGSLVNRNTFLLASLVGGITGFVVAARQTVTAGRMMEQNMMALNATLTAAGDRIDLTSAQANELARTLGRDLLIGANDARRAITQLATFTNVAEEDFGRIIKTAQGMSVMTGSLRENVKKLGRVLENPAENLNTLSETGVEFTEQMRDQIETLVRLGRRQEANAIILERLSSFQSIAEDEAKSLSGQIDTLGENFLRFFEEASAAGGVTDSLTGIFREFNEQITAVIDDGSVVEAFGKAVNATFSTMAKVVQFAARNFEMIASVISNIFVARALGGLLTGVGGAIKIVRGLSINLSALGSAARRSATGITTAAAATRTLGLAARALPFVGVLAAATDMFSAFKSGRSVLQGFGDNVRIMADSVDGARRSIEGLTEAESQLRMINLREQVADLRGEMLETSGRISDLRSNLERFSDLDPNVFDQFIRGTITFQELSDSASLSLDDQRQRLIQLRDAYINGSAALRTKTQALRNLQEVLSSSEVDIWALQETLEGLLGTIDESGRNISDMMNTLDEHRERIFKEEAATREWMEQTEELNRVLVGLHQEGEITTEMMDRFLGANLALNPALEDNSKSAEQYRKSLSDLLNTLRTDFERAQRTAIQQTIRLDDAFLSGNLTLQQYAEAIGRVNKNLKDAKDTASNTEKEMSKFAEQAARNMQDAFADFLFDPFEDGVEGMLNSFIEAIRRMIAEWVAAQALEGMGEALDFSGGGKNPGKNPDSGVESLGQMPSSMSLSGKSSLSQDQIGTLSSKGNVGVTINVINNSDSEVRQEESTDANGNRRLDLIIDDMMAERINQGGRTTKALEQRFGNLRRSGR